METDLHDSVLISFGNEMERLAEAARRGDTRKDDLDGTSGLDGD